MQAANIVLNVFIICIMISLLFSVVILNKGKLRKREEKYIVHITIMLGIVSFIYIIYLLVDGKSKYADFNQVINGVIFSLGFLITFIYAKYVECILEYKEIKDKTFLPITLMLTVIGISLDLISIKNKMYFFVEDGFYRRGSMFFVNQFIAVGIELYIAAVIIKNRKKLGNIQFISLISYLVIPAVSVIIQLFVHDIMMLYPSIVISLIMLFGISYEEQRREMNEKFLQSKIDIMMAQIRPHFMYNSLTAIYGLCEKDPKRAKMAIGYFSKYLRCNIDSISKREMIDFTQELKHIESYLNLEKMRYDDRLSVVYHIETDEFNIPALCIQPLVENSIKHGINMMEDGGILYLSTKETKRNYVITVEDTGDGFDYNAVKDDGKVHVGIENVKMRIRNMCGGTLDVLSECNKGTKVIVTIPKHGNQRNII